MKKQQHCSVEYKSELVNNLVTPTVDVMVMKGLRFITLTLFGSPSKVRIMCLLMQITTVYSTHLPVPDSITLTTTKCMLGNLLLYRAALLGFVFRCCLRTGFSKPNHC